MAMSKNDFQKRRSAFFGRDEDEEKDLTPSKVASFEQKRKEFFSEEAKSKREELTKPEPESEKIEIKPGKSFLQTSKDFISSKLGIGKKKEAIEAPTFETAETTAQDSYTVEEPKEKSIAKDLEFYARKLKAGAISTLGITEAGIGSQAEGIIPVVSQLTEEATKDRLKSTIKLLENDLKEGQKTKVGAFGSKKVFISQEEKADKQGQIDNLKSKLEEIEKRDAETLTTTEKLVEKGLGNIEKAQKEREVIAEELGTPKKWSGKWLAGEVLDSTPQLIGSFGLGIGVTFVTKNPTIGLAVGYSSSFVQESGSAYADAIEAGLSEHEAQQAGANVGVINATIEQLPLAIYLSKVPNGSEIKSQILKRVGGFLINRIKQGTAEGVTESVQEIVSNAVKKTYDENAELFTGMKESGAIGFLLGMLIPTNLNRKVNIQENENVSETANRIIEEAINTEPDVRTKEQQAMVNEVTRLRLEEEGKPIPPELDSELETTAIAPAPVRQPARVVGEESPQITAPTSPTEKGVTPQPQEVVSPTVKKELEPLAQEARKYKSADEFVKAQVKDVDKELTTDLFSDIKYLKENDLVKITTMDERFGVTKQELLDSRSYTPDVNRKIRDIVDIIQVEPKLKSVLDEDTLRILDSSGYGKFARETTVSHSQLTDIWNQATKKKPEVLKEIKYDPSRLELKIYNPETFGNPLETWQLQARYKGFLADKLNFATEKEARTAMENYKFKGMTTNVADDYSESKFFGETYFENLKPKPAERKALPKAVQTKPRAIKIQEPKKVDKKVIFRTSDRKQIQTEVESVVSGKTAKNQEEAVRQIDTLTKEHLNNVEDPLYTKKLRAVKAEMKRQMYELVGANTGNWKKDYAYFNSLRDNPDFNQMIDKMEDSILQIDEAINRNAPSSSLGHSTSGSISIGKFESRVTPNQGTREFKMYEQVKALTQKYAKSIGEGYTPRNALGVYYTKTKNIRVNAINNLSTATHEITHFLDHTYSISDKLLAVKGYAVNGNPIYDPSTMKYRKEMTSLYEKYYPGGKKTHSLRKRSLEGFATLLQKYTEAPQRIKGEYPLLVKDFLEPNGKYYQPVMGEIIKDLSVIVEEYQGLGSLDKIGAKVTSDKTNVDKGSFLSFRDKLRTFLSDEVYPIEMLAKKAGTQLTKDDPSLWLRAYNSIGSVVNNNIATNRGYWNLTGDGIKKVHDFNWKTLVDITTENKTTDDFGHYLVARREFFSYQELDILKTKAEEAIKIAKETPKEDRDAINTKTGKTVLQEAQSATEDYKSLRDILKKDGFTRQEVTEAYSENKERFIEEEKMFDTLTKSDIDFLHSEAVQLITDTQYKNLTTKEGYASFKREFYDDVVGDSNEITGSVKVGKTKVASLIRRKGSERTIINPLYNGITNHSEIVRKGAKQIVYNKLTDIGVSAMFPDLFQELDLSIAKDSKTGVITYPQEKDPNIIMGRKNFKRKPVLIDGELKNVVDNILTYQNIDTFVRLYTGMSRMFTAGTTGFYPQFTATNLIRDQITAQANTTNKYKALYTPLKEFGLMLQKKDGENYGYYQEYMIMGGERQTFTGWQKLPPKKLFERIKGEKKALEKALAIGEKATDVLSTPAKYSELISRFGEYAQSRKNGNPPIVALEEAGRLTAPFHHLGSWGGKYGQIFIRGLPFFNAGLQVLDQHARVAQTPEGRRRLAFVMMAITAAYLASMLALKEASDEQKDQYRDLKPDELANGIYIPLPNRRKLFRIPMSNVFTPLGAVLNMVIADEIFGTKYKKSDYWKASSAVIPDQFDVTEPTRAFFSWIPQVFKAGTETIVGYKTYPEVSPLESMSLKNLPPGLRSNNDTSKFAKWLGEKANLSPIKIDYLITGYLGRATGLVTGKPSAWDFDSSFVRDYWFSNGRRVNGMYDIKEENDQKYSAYQRGEIELSKDGEKELYRKYVLSNSFTDVMGDFRLVDIEKDQEKASDLRNEALQIINIIENGDDPRRQDIPKSYSGFRDWQNQARNRRKDKIKELEKSV